MTDLFGQGGYDVRFEWGLAGARAVRADAAVVVDVLSFSTAVTIAVERGMTVFPYRWEDDGAEAYAAERDAVLAVGRGEEHRPGGPPAPSLSPSALRACRPVERLVLPSPNGSTIAAELQEHGGRVAVGCLRNATATARWLAQALDAGRSVAVIAAGERWAQDGSLRPALEDHLAAGAILSGVIGRGHGERMSPEGHAAANLMEASRGRVGERMRDCVSGRELVGRGHAADVAVAAELDVSAVVPELVDGAFGGPGRGHR